MALRQLLKDVGEQNMVFVHYQTHGGGSDTLWNMNDSLRILYYGVQFVPTTFMDACSSKVGSSGTVQGDSVIFAQWYNSRRPVSSPLSIALSGSYNRTTRQGRARVSIIATGNIIPTNLRIRYFLLENLPYVWTNGSIVVTGIDHVVRKMMPDPAGVPLTISIGQTVADSQSFRADTVANQDSCEIAVFVQSDQTREVLQGSWSNLPSFSGVQGNPAEEIPESFFLSAPAPSPCTRKTQIAFGLPRESDVSLKVYDLMGREIKTLVASHEKAGWQVIGWDARTRNGRPVPGGVYFFRLEAQGRSLTRRVVVLR